MKSTIDQIAFNTDELKYTLFISFSGNQHRILITEKDAHFLILSAKGQYSGKEITQEFDKTEKIIYWIFRDKQAQ